MINDLSTLYALYRHATPGEIEAERTTVRLARLPDDLGLALSPDHRSTEVFRPVLLRETFTQHDDGSVGYDVTVTGPVITSKGNDHKGRRESARWTWTPNGQEPADEIPEPIVRHLFLRTVLGGPWPLQELPEAAQDQAPLPDVPRGRAAALTDPYDFRDPDFDTPDDEELCDDCGAPMHEHRDVTTSDGKVVSMCPAYAFLCPRW